MTDDNIIHFTIGWMNKCQHNDKKKLIPNLHNAMIALRSDHRISDCFGYDEMLRATVVLAEINQLRTTCDLVRPARWLTDNDAIRVCLWLQENGFPNMAVETARKALLERTSECAFHPLRDYLQSVVWDEIPRLNVWMSSYL